MLTEIERIAHWVDLDKLNENSFIVDAGAGRGEFIDQILKIVKCKIFAIEPNEDNMTELRSRPVDIFHGALVGRNMPKEMTFYSHSGREWEKGNLFHLYGEGDKQCIVPTMTLDTGCINTKVALLKLDIEGAEKDLIETMTQEDANRIEQICMEVHKNCDINKIKEKLETLGYKVQLLPRSELYATR